MSEINENKVSFSKPTSEDEVAKSEALEAWTNDRSDMLFKFPEFNFSNEEQGG